VTPIWRNFWYVSSPFGPAKVTNMAASIDVPIPTKADAKSAYLGEIHDPTTTRTTPMEVTIHQ
jgi:hypothetical protein